MLQQQLTEGIGSVLTASVRMEDEMIAGLPSFQRCFERCSHKLCAGLWRYFVCDHFPGKQVENGAEVISIVVNRVYSVKEEATMANKYLLPIFKKLYGCDFSYGNFDQRLEMQKAIYLLQDMGVPVGDYGFRWYQHGPYSQSLQDDMYYESGRQCESICLSKEHADSIEKLRQLIDSKEKNNYTTSQWVECLASLHYLRENLLSFSATKEDIVSALEKRKPHLSNHNTNLSALQLVEELFA